jgi:chromosome partitioning protein
MTQIQSGKPIQLQRAQIEELQAVNVMPVLQTSIRNSPRFFAEAGPSGIPAVLQGALNDPVSVELRALTSEFVEAISGQER